MLGLPTDLGAPSWDVQVRSSAASFPVDLCVSMLRQVPLVVLLVLHLYSAGVQATEANTSSADGEHCRKQLGFNETYGPKDRSAQDLNFCTEHHKRTCCERSQTQKVLVSFALYSQEQSSRCVQFARMALCSVCDGDVGVGLKSRQNSVLLCHGFCKQWYEACLRDFFAPRGSQGLQPCVPGSLVCSPLGEITQDSREFCSRVGDFEVATEEEYVADVCYDGIPSAIERGPGPRAPYTRPVRPGQSWLMQMLTRFEYFVYRIVPYRALELIQRYAAAMMVTAILLCVGGSVLLRGSALRSEPEDECDRDDAG